jgi:hypothetical protein
MNVFSVQRTDANTDKGFGDCVTVEALCPVGAGELVLSEPLALHGSVLRAKIWFLKDDYTPQSVELYSAAASQLAV